MIGAAELARLAALGGLPALAALTLLALGLVLSMLICLDRLRAIRRAGREADRFESRFWSGVELAALLADAGARRAALAGPEAVFEAGFREFARLRQKPGLSRLLQREGAQRAMRSAVLAEISGIGANIPMLVRIARAAPGVGAVGGLLSVVVALDSAGGSQGYSLAATVPAVAVAALVLAAGLSVAIPARCAASELAERVRRERLRLEAFQEDLSGLLDQIPD